MLKTWEELRSVCSECTSCELGKTKKNMVFGRGNVSSKVMLVGEGPGEQEDLRGEPFVGKAGILLDHLLNALMISQEDVYIANIVKCRPPQNRVPFEEEANCCIKYLRNQVYLQEPKIIVCLGSTAAKYIIDKNIRISKIRGNWVEKKGIFIMPTFHPAALLRDNSKKVLMWEDFKKIKLKMGEI